ncbi:hypothetical protein AW40_26610 [Kosakonia radicincitans UMEnt01/12]|uniref:hypothetical protein n=1 Tax=Kosakonia radicincitans TaxID=283686 RepID=UPI00046131CC|nr:hypothetical protein [Kosakonia radicincitans]KDE33662.1 hypothetical protein AW40_26610 [Kosakonia radicincitans UMEnt01/12]
MSKIVIPFELHYLERASRFLAQHDIDCDIDDFIYLWGENKITICYYFKDGVNGENDHGEIERLTGVFYPEYKQITDFINKDYSIVDIPLRVRDSWKKVYYVDCESLMLHSDEYGDFLNFRPKEDLCITSEEILKVYEIFTGEEAIKIHMNTENRAQYRERLYMQAIRVLIDHPEECKGRSGRLTQTAWAKAIMAHFPDYGYPHIGNEETIVRLLRKAMHIINEKK